MDAPRHDGIVGVGLAAVGALAYGIATVIGRALAGAGVDSATALGIRFSVAAAVLAVLLRLRGAPMRPSPGEWLPIVLLGAIGYTLESTLFYLSMGHGTAAACILLFYAYPAIVTVIELGRGREQLTAATALALGLSVVGTAAVVAIGRDVSISVTGIVLALAAATTYALYLIVGRDVRKKTDCMTTACWVAAGAAIASLMRGVVGGTLRIPSGHLLQIACYGVVTAAAFGLTFAALARIGATHTAVVMTLEAASTVLLAGVVLGEGISAAQAAGGAAVLTAAAVIARSHRRERPQNVRNLRRVVVQTRALAGMGTGMGSAESARSAPGVARFRAAGLSVVGLSRERALVGESFEVAPRRHP
jgi:drug/metabolite transporter (DMT)-like permease